MTDNSEYVPPKIWTWDKESGGRFANINRPIAGPTHDKDLPIGRHPLQLYSLGTPNGVKVTVMLEELLAAGHAGAEYDAWLINIGEGRSEEHTSELQSLMRISYAVSCLKKKTQNTTRHTQTNYKSETDKHNNTK